MIAHSSIPSHFPHLLNPCSILNSILILLYFPFSLLAILAIMAIVTTIAFLLAVLHTFDTLHYTEFTQPSGIFVVSVFTIYTHVQSGVNISMSKSQLKEDNKELERVMLRHLSDLWDCREKIAELENELEEVYGHSAIYWQQIEELRALVAAQAAHIVRLQEHLSSSL